LPHEDSPIMLFTGLNVLPHIAQVFNKVIPLMTF